MSQVLEKKKGLFDDIIHCRRGLAIENVFGQAAWDFYQQRLGQANCSIIVCGNGPVGESVTMGNEIDRSKDVIMRCNDYLSVYRNGHDRVGRRCDVQVICLHGGEYSKHGLEFLRKWCSESEMVLALENTKARLEIQRAVENLLKMERGPPDECFNKFHFVPEKYTEGWNSVFRIDCTRGFYAIAFALQVNRRLEMGTPVKCVGFGRAGHHDNKSHRIHHQHSEELLLYADLWRRGDKLMHLEWAESSQELLEHISKVKFMEAIPPPHPAIPPAEHFEAVQDCAEMLERVTKVACESQWYRKVPMVEIQSMVAHGLIVYPDLESVSAKIIDTSNRDACRAVWPEEPKIWLTCKHHFKKNRYPLFQCANSLKGHFSQEHNLQVEKNQVCQPKSNNKKHDADKPSHEKSGKSAKVEPTFVFGVTDPSVLGKPLELPKENLWGGVWEEPPPLGLWGGPPPPPHPSAGEAAPPPPPPPRPVLDWHTDPVQPDTASMNRHRAEQQLMMQQPSSSSQAWNTWSTWNTWHRQFNVFDAHRAVPRQVNMMGLMKSYALFQSAAQDFVDASNSRNKSVTLMIVRNIAEQCRKRLDKLASDMECNARACSQWYGLHTLKIGATFPDIFRAFQVVLHVDNVTDSHWWNYFRITVKGDEMSFTQVLSALSDLMKQMLDGMFDAHDPVQTNDAVKGIMSFNFTSKDEGSKAIAIVKHGSAGVSFRLNGARYRGQAKRAAMI